jgi:TRAP-type C4-dicarboxylate transport system substrate-binding protein
MRRGKLFAVCVASAFLALSATARAETHLKAVAPFDQGHIMVKSFMQFIAKVNAEGKGILQIDYMGGAEVIPAGEQGSAVGKGFVDLQEGPASYYLGQVPGGDAVYGMKGTPAELRRNGGLEILSKHWVRKLNANLLAIPDSGVSNMLYFSDKPKMKPDGDLDLSGMKIRITPTYREVVKYFDGVGVSISANDVYTALKRNIVQGLGWPSVAVADADWHEFAKYRLEPGFLSGAYVMIINHDKWRSLSQPAKDLLTRVATEWEVESRHFMESEQAKEKKELMGQGMKLIELSPEAKKRYQDFAYDIAWGRLRKADPQLAESLKGKAY